MKKYRSVNPNVIAKYGNLYKCKTHKYALYNESYGESPFGETMETHNGILTEPDSSECIVTNLTMKTIIRCFKNEIYVGMFPVSTVIKFRDDLDFILDDHSKNVSMNRSSKRNIIEALECTVEDIENVIEHIHLHNPGAVKEDDKRKTKSMGGFKGVGNVGAGIGNLNDKHSLNGATGDNDNNGVHIARPRNNGAGNRGRVNQRPHRGGMTIKSEGI